MRHLIRSTILGFALVAGCSPDRITTGSRSPVELLPDRGGPDAGTFQFTTIDPPGATWAQASGINARGDVVGQYSDAAGISHGFLLRGGQYTTIDVPDDVAGGVVSGTSANGIAPDGEIVGSYSVAGEPGFYAHGFRRTASGDFVRVHDVDHINEIPQRVLPDGTILGCVHDHDLGASMRGLILGRRDTTVIDAPSSMINGATPDHHHLAGLWDKAVGLRVGVSIDDGVLQIFEVPGSNLTAAWDMNPAGVIVGNYRTGDGTTASPRVFHGFIRTVRDDESGGSTVSYRSVDVPGAQRTTTVGINAGGTIVGGYSLGGTMHAYMATTIPPGQQ